VLNESSSSIADFNSFTSKEHFFSFDMDLPEGAILHNAYLQFMLWSNSSTHPLVDISIEVLGTSNKFVQQSKNRMVRRKATFELDSGHVWISPNLSDILQHFVPTQKVSIVVSAEMDQTAGRFGFLAKHPHMERCLAPTLFVSYQ
jgi:hypothetical protein